MTDAPLCDCHGEPKVWHVGKGRPNGGNWRCRVKDALAAKRYRERHPEKVKATSARRNALRVTVGDVNAGGYFGYASTPEQAAAISARGREMLGDFKESQKEVRVAAGS